VTPDKRSFSDRQLEQVQIRDEENRFSWCITRGKRQPPPGGIIDAMAEHKLTGGFSVHKDNLCPDCKEYRSVNGACACPE
jgi:hypothetical protein